jgi:hypothetical protein
VISLHDHVQGFKKVVFFKKLKYFSGSKFGKTFAPKKKEKKRNYGSNHVENIRGLVSKKDR